MPPWLINREFPGVNRMAWPGTGSPRRLDKIECRRAESCPGPRAQLGRGLATAGIVVGVITFIVAIWYWVVIAKYSNGGHGGGGGSGGGGY